MEKYRVKINEKVYEVEIEKMEASTVAVPTPKQPVVGTSNVSATLKAPVQGTVLKIHVKPGQAIKAGDVVCVIEAMKLENDIVSDRDGVVDDILVKQQDTVDNGQDLISYRG